MSDQKPEAPRDNTPVVPATLRCLALPLLLSTAVWVWL